LEEIKDFWCPEQFVGQNFIAESFEITDLTDQSILTESRISVTYVTCIQILYQVVAKRLVQRGIFKLWDMTKLYFFYWHHAW
jgi:hypothetical protein